MNLKLFISAIVLLLTLTACGASNKPNKTLTKPTSQQSTTPVTDTNSLNQQTTTPITNNNPSSQQASVGTDNTMATNTNQQTTSTNDNKPANSDTSVVSNTDNSKNTKQGVTAVTAAKSTPSPASKQALAVTQKKVKTNVTIISITSPVSRNSTAILKAKITPGATASIQVHYKSGISKAAGLESKKADKNGNVSWSWNVDTNTALGKWPITVTSNGSSAGTRFEVIP
jgi:hypothetical protein